MLAGKAMATWKQSFSTRNYSSYNETYHLWTTLCLTSGEWAITANYCLRVKCGKNPGKKNLAQVTWLVMWPLSGQLISPCLPSHLAQRSPPFFHLWLLCMHRSASAMLGVSENLVKWAYPRALCSPHHLGQWGEKPRPPIWLLFLPQHQGKLTDSPVAFVGPKRKLPEDRNADNPFLIKRNILCGSY